MPAKLFGETLPATYRFKLGSFEVATIMDSHVIRPGLTPSFGGEAHADEIRALAKANHISDDKYFHPFTPMLVNTGKELVLFDTGNGALSRENEPLKGRLPPGQLVARMGELGYKPEDVDVVVITHGHPDHIGGLTEDGKPVFPNARYVYGAAEFDFWNKGENVREARKFNRVLYMKYAAPFANSATMIKPGDTVVPGITAVDAAGHSPGLMAFMIESDGKQLLNWADTCNHYVVAIQRPDIHLDVDDDKEKAVATRKRILEMASKEQLLVAGYHMPYPGLGYVDKTATGYRWVPHSYQMLV